MRFSCSNSALVDAIFCFAIFFKFLTLFSFFLCLHLLQCFIPKVSFRLYMVNVCWQFSAITKVGKIYKKWINQKPITKHWLFRGSVETIQDFLIKLDIKPLMHLLEVSIFSLNDDILRLTKIMN